MQLLITADCFDHDITSRLLQTRCFVMCMAQELSIADDFTLSLSVAIVFSKYV